MAGRVVNTIKFSGASAANTAKTVSTVDADATTATRSGGDGSENTRLRLLWVTVTYSAAPTYTATNLIVSLNSGIASFYDTTLTTGSTNDAQHFAYVPDGEIVIPEDDVIDVTAPAGGAGIISYITICCERLS